MTNDRPWLPIAFAALSLILSPVQAGDPASSLKTVRYRITGLFQPDRVDDLRAAMREWPEMTLASIDYQTTEAEFRFDEALVFPDVKPGKIKPAQMFERLNNKLRSVTAGNFSLRELSDVPREKLVRVEIPILGLDCKGCSFGAYEAVYQLPGVERATASFHDGHVIAWINPEQTDRAKLDAALKQHRITLKESK